MNPLEVANAISYDLAEKAFAYGYVLGAVVTAGLILIFVHGRRALRRASW